MTAEHAALIYGIVTTGTTLFSRKAEAVWVAVLCSPQQQDVTFEHARLAVLDLLGEVEPRKIYPALVLTKARSIQKTLAPSTVQLLEAEDERLRLESPREHRQRLTVQDRAALARLAQAFAQQKQMPAFDHLMTTLREKCHLDVGEDDPGDESVPF